jgi:hypothetical protein
LPGAQSEIGISNTLCPASPADQIREAPGRLSSFEEAQDLIRRVEYPFSEKADFVGKPKEDLQMRNFKAVRFAWSKEILSGVVMYKSAEPMRHDFEYAVLVKGKRLSNTSDKRVVMKRPRGDISILLSIEHTLLRRKDVNDAIRIAMEDDVDANMVGRN